MAQHYIEHGPDGGTRSLSVEEEKEKTTETLIVGLISGKSSNEHKSKIKIGKYACVKRTEHTFTWTGPPAFPSMNSIVPTTYIVLRTEYSVVRPGISRPIPNNCDRRSMDPYIFSTDSASPVDGRVDRRSPQGCFGRPSISRGSTTSGSSGTKAPSPYYPWMYFPGEGANCFSGWRGSSKLGVVGSWGLVYDINVQPSMYIRPLPSLAPFRKVHVASCMGAWTYNIVPGGKERGSCTVEGR